MSSSVVDESAVGDPQEVVAARGHEEDVDQEVVPEMVAFNAEEVAEVEGFEEWTGQQQEDETAGAVVSHDDHQQHQQHHHIIEGAVMLSTGSQVVLVDAETVDGRVLTRSVPSTGDPSAQPTTAHTFCCTLCNTVFPSKAGLVAHQRREHPNAVVTSSTSPVASPSATMASGAGAATSSGSASTEAARRSHICSMCNKGFTTSSNLHQHRRLHFNERPFQCNQCNKGFATSTNLKQHYRTHTGDRPYPCMYCPKRFATNSNLRQHIRTHTGERPHVCVYPGCGRGFNDATKLANHQRTHTGERPFICPICGNDFVTRNNLKSHTRSHYDPKHSVQRQKEQKRHAPHEISLRQRTRHGSGRVEVNNKEAAYHVGVQSSAASAEQSAQCPDEGPSCSTIYGGGNSGRENTQKETAETSQKDLRDDRVVECVDDEVGTERPISTEKYTAIETSEVETGVKTAERKRKSGPAVVVRLRPAKAVD